MRQTLTAVLSISAFLAVAPASARDLTLDDRAAGQRAIERLYWNQRIWPKENPQAKPPLSAVMSEDSIRAKVEDYLKKSIALDTWWQRPITAEQLQAERNRMAKDTRPLIPPRAQSATQEISNRPGGHDAKKSAPAHHRTARSPRLYGRPRG